MADRGHWDAQKMLDMYIHDYMVKNNMHTAAEIFANEANVGANSAVMDSPDAFLTEWWAIFWDFYSSRVLTRPQAMEGSSVEANEYQNNCTRVPRPDQQSERQFPPSSVFEEMLAQPAASLLASKVFGGKLRLPGKELNPDLWLLDADKLHLSKPSSSHASYSQLQIPRSAKQWTPRDSSWAVSLGGTIPAESSLHGVSKSIFPTLHGLSTPGLPDAGTNKAHPFKNIELAPFPAIDQITPGIVYPVPNSFLPVPNNQFQFQTSMPHQQQDLLHEVMGKTRGKQILSPFQGSANNLGNLMLPRSGFSSTDGQMMVTGRQIEEQQMLAPKRKKTAEHQMLVADRQTLEQQMNVPVRKTAEQKMKLPVVQTADQQQSHENRRKRKNLSKPQYGENVSDGRNADGGNNMSTSFSNLNKCSTTFSINEQDEFSFEEVGSLNSSKGEVLCCHFSTDGMLLASAGSENKVYLWNTDSFDLIDIAEGHSNLITDVRFKPTSAIFATSSFDGTVQLWDSNKPNKSLCKLLGSTEKVNSVDFHPRKLDLLCSCGSNDEIRLWSIHHCACMHIFKGATRQVRFQPRVGDFLAAASGNGINLFDVETSIIQCYLEGHVKEVRSICWDASGKYMASVSEDSARLWSTVSGGKCIYELRSKDKKFESCTFHPGYSQLLVIGSYQTLDLWNPTVSSKTSTVPAHNGIVAALADCPQTELIASASHDQCVKVWR